MVGSTRSRASRRRRRPTRLVAVAAVVLHRPSLAIGRPPHPPTHARRRRRPTPAPPAALPRPSSRLATARSHLRALAARRREVRGRGSQARAQTAPRARHLRAAPPPAALARPEVEQEEGPRRPTHVAARPRAQASRRRRARRRPLREAPPRRAVATRRVVVRSRAIRRRGCARRWHARCSGPGARRGRRGRHAVWGAPRRLQQPAGRRPSAQLLLPLRRR